MQALKKIFQAIRETALSFPETREDHPWGETAIKVRGKTFLFMGFDESALHLSMKLTVRHEFALQYPFVAPTHYGLGKSGWITASFAAKDKPPMDVLTAWLDESYRAIAQKSTVAKMEAARGGKARSVRRSRGRR